MILEFKWSKIQGKSVRLMFEKYEKRLLQMQCEIKYLQHSIQCIIHQPLHKVYEAYWRKFSLLSVLNDWINLSPAELIKTVNKYKNKIHDIKFNEWLQLIAHIKCTDSMKLILTQNPPIMFAGLKRKQKDLLSKMLISLDHDMIDICHHILVNIMNIPSNIYQCHKLTNFDKDKYRPAVEFFSSKRGVNCIHFCHQVA
eukprot:401964_1